MHTCHVISDISDLSPPFEIDHLEIVNYCTLGIVYYLLGDLGQALFIRSCHENVILARKMGNWAGTAFSQGDSAGGSKLIEQSLNVFLT